MLISAADVLEEQNRKQPQVQVEQSEVEQGISIGNNVTGYERRSFSLPDQRPYFSVRNFFPHLNGVEPISPPPESESEADIEVTNTMQNGEAMSETDQHWMLKWRSNYNRKVKMSASS